MTAPLGRILYTVDGSDPRLPGGDVSLAANEFGAGERTTLVPARSEVRVLVPQDDTLGVDWIAPEYNDETWLQGETGVGFERSSGYEDLILTDVGEQMFQNNATVYLRIAFEVENPSTTFLTLSMKYDDGFVAYLNGKRVAASNAPEDPRWDSTAAASHSDTQAVRFEDFDLSDDLATLRAGRNVLAIHGMNQSRTNGDMLILPQLEAAEPPGEDDALVLTTTTHLRTRAWRDGEWSPLTEATFITPGLRITEIMYHPESNPESFDADDFEFIELMNVADQRIDLDGARLAGGLRFAFEDGDVRSLGPGDIVLVVKNAEAFAALYDTRGMNIAGEYAGSLSNRGEEIILEGRVGERILQFTFIDSWYPATDGDGRSLVIVDAAGDPDTWDDATRWRPSRDVHGSPGVHAKQASNGWQLIGDANQDALVNITDAIASLRFLFAGAAPTLPCGEGSLEDAGNVLLLDVSSDGAVNVEDPVYLLNYLFSRGAPPALGTGCIRIAECPNLCQP